MAKELKKHFGIDYISLMLSGCSGNLNHFDFFAKDWTRGATKTPRYVQMGKVMAETVIKLFDKAKPMSLDVLSAEKEIMMLFNVCDNLIDIFVRYDKEGNMIWEKKWGGNRHERFTEVIQSENGGYIAVGQTNSSDLEGISETVKYISVIVEFDKDGNVITAKTWEPNGDNKQSEFMNIIKSKDGNYILTARNDSTNLQNITNKDFSLLNETYFHYLSSTPFEIEGADKFLQKLSEKYITFREKETPKTSPSTGILCKSSSASNICFI